jgi:hypothetical protein
LLPFHQSPVANRQSPFAVHYSLLAIRYSLPFSARHETRPPTIFRLSGSGTAGLKGLTRNLQPSPAFPTPDGFIVIPEEVTHLEAGTTVTVTLFE